MASIVYIESPAGVGYSYSTDGNVKTDDDQVQFENNFLETSFYFQKFNSLQFTAVLFDYFCCRFGSETLPIITATSFCIFLHIAQFVEKFSPQIIPILITS